MISEREQKSTHERLRWRSSWGSARQPRLRSVATVQIRRAARHVFPKLAASWTFHGDGLTDAVDPFETLGTRSTAGAYWQPSHFQRARLTRYHALSQA